MKCRIFLLIIMIIILLLNDKIVNGIFDEIPILYNWREKKPGLYKIAQHYTAERTQQQQQ